tara:strand:- start:44 stop:163 length:120 start_codon:yes stop_codon:yes gene_type:complete
MLLGALRELVILGLPKTFFERTAHDCMKFRGIHFLAFRF